MKVEVRRASQVHQIPQTGRAQSGPVISPMVQQITPTSTPETPEEVPFAIAGDEIGDVGDRRRRKRRRTWRSSWHVEIEDALDGVHGGFVRRDEKGGVACAENQQGDDRCDWQCELSSAARCS